MAVYNDRFYISDANQNAVLVFDDNNGTLLHSIGHYPGIALIAISDDGILYIADQSLLTISVYNTTTEPEVYLGIFGNGTKNQNIISSSISLYTVVYNPVAQQIYTNLNNSIGAFDKNGNYLYTLNVGGFSDLKIDNNGSIYTLTYSKNMLIFNSSGFLINNFTLIEFANANYFVILPDGSIMYLDQTTTLIQITHVPSPSNSSSHFHLKSSSEKKFSSLSSFHSIVNGRPDNIVSIVIGIVVPVVVIVVATGIIFAYYRKHPKLKIESKLDTQSAEEFVQIQPSPIGIQSSFNTN